MNDRPSDTESPDSPGSVQAFEAWADRNSRPDILTVGGDYFNFLSPETSVITIEAIAHGLAHVCRFAGQCREFYSVAQHSVMVSMLVPREHALAALLHDAAEAFCGDVAKPLKLLLPEYKVIEDRVERAIFARFGIDPVLPDCIKIADLTMLATEKRDLMNRRGGEWPLTSKYRPLPAPIKPVLPYVAKMMFLREFDALQGIQHHPV